MDDDIAEAVSRLLLVSGDSDRAKEYLEAYIERENSLDLTSTSTSSLSCDTDLRRSPADVILPQRFLLPTTNPWREGRETPTEFIGSPQPRDLNSPSRFPEILPHDRRRDHTARCGREPRGQPDWPPTGHVWAGPSPPMTPIRAQSNRPKGTARSLLRNMRDAPQPSPAIFTPSLISDQLPSAHGRWLTPSPEPAGSSCDVCETVHPSPSPSRVRRISGRCPTHHDGVSDVTSLHHDLVIIGCNESRLSNSDFEIVKSKIRANPEYVGERPYIRVQNPQYMVTNLVHHPPTTGTGKWYQVSVGRAVGVFSDWGTTAAATQGVTRAVFKSYSTRGEAIVAYQAMLLKGEVLLVNERRTERERRK